MMKLGRVGEARIYLMNKLLGTAFLNCSISDLLIGFYQHENWLLILYCLNMI